MSGRARPFIRDGQPIGYRKTDRRNPRRDPRERLQEVLAAGADHFPVRLAFRLPKSLEAFVASGRHGIGIEVLSRGFVRIGSGSAEQCFMAARGFLRAIAKDRPAFTAQAVIVCATRPHERYGRFLTVLNGGLVVSAGGLIEPRVYE